MTELVSKSEALREIQYLTNSHAEVVNRLEKQLTEALKEVAILKTERAACLGLIQEGRKWQDLMRQMKLTADDWAMDADKTVTVQSNEFDDYIPRRMVGRKLDGVYSVPVDFVLASTVLVYRVVVGEVQS